MNCKKGIKGFLEVPLAERFWGKVERRGDNECWLWLGASFGPNGMKYGSIWVDGRYRKAHQVSWEIYHGRPFPEGRIGCHSCDNPQCVNPRHIWPGTKADNSRDAARKGRLKIPMMPRKSHCRRGHEMVGANVIQHHQKGRICRACRDLRNRARYDNFARQALEPK